MQASVRIVEVSGPEQIEAARKLFLQYREGLFSKCQMPDEEWQFLPGAYSSPSGALVLAEVAGAAAGCVGLRPFAPEPTTGEMKRLFVLSEYRGNSVGEALVRAIIRVARERGYQHIRLDTHVPTMISAIRLYRRMGFREIPAAPLQPMDELLYMGLDLD